MKDGLVQSPSGLYVAAKVMTPRKFARLYPFVYPDKSGTGVLAIANDGTAWGSELSTKMEWVQLPDLPPAEA